jgi:hypothetical protein
MVRERKQLGGGGLLEKKEDIAIVVERLFSNLNEATLEHEPGEFQTSLFPPQGFLSLSLSLSFLFALFCVEMNFFLLALYFALKRDRVCCCVVAVVVGANKQVVSVVLCFSLKAPRPSLPQTSPPQCKPFACHCDLQLLFLLWHSLIFLREEDILIASENSWFMILL